MVGGGIPANEAVEGRLETDNLQGRMEIAQVASLRPAGILVRTSGPHPCLVAAYGRVYDRVAPLVWVPTQSGGFHTLGLTR